MKPRNISRKWHFYEEKLDISKLNESLAWESSCAYVYGDDYERFNGDACDCKDK